MKGLGIQAVSVLLLLLAAGAGSAAPVGTGFTYQGRLQTAGMPANGTATLRFSLWDDPGSGSPPVGGNQLGNTQVFFGLPVTNGVFTVILNASGEFGLSAFDGQARWLQVTICKDDACSDRAILTPRQPVTATPYALALPGLNRHSLDAADGDPKDAVYVDDEGRVGIGTTQPQASLDSPYGLFCSGDLGDVQFAEIADLVARVGNFNLVPDEPAMRLMVGPNYLLTVLNNGHVGIGTTTPQSALDIANGSLTLSGSGGGISFVETADIYARVLDASPIADDPAFRFRTAGSDLLTILNNGRVGIGSSTPTAALEVRGDVKMGASGQIYAAGGDEKLRLVRGHVEGNGIVFRGTGFTSERLEAGRYQIIFDPPFSADYPILTVTAYNSAGPAIATIGGWNGTQAVIVETYTSDGTRVDIPFVFTAIDTQ